MGNPVKGEMHAGFAIEFDSLTHERVLIGAPVYYKDDFLGAGAVVIPAAGSAENGVDWVKKIVGTGPPTVAGVANAAGGQIACALTATSEKQDAAIYQGDQKNFDVTKSLTFDAVAQLAVLPSGAGAQMVLGMSDVWIDGPDNAAHYIQFGAKANGTISARIKDGTTTQEVTTGVTLVAGVAHTFRIDASDVTNVKYYIDGNQVCATTKFAYAATGANSILQPYASMYKASGVVVGTLQVDKITVFTGR